MFDSSGREVDLKQLGVCSLAHADPSQRLELLRKWSERDKGVLILSHEMFRSLVKVSTTMEIEIEPLRLMDYQ